MPVSQTKLIGGFFDGLFGVRIHEQFGLRHNVLLNPFEGRNTALTKFGD
ncbi:MAG: hypothetical protein IJR42_03605 [Paludibacteraceae bacterium]|nr:hypothetical protein [Paludibacteraceae bacterium]